MYKLTIQEKHLEKYWIDLLSGAASHSLVFLKPMELAGPYERQEYTSEPSAALQALLEKVSGGNDAAAYLLLLAGLCITYRRFSACNDFVVSSRGLYYRCKISDDDTALEVLQQLKNTWLQYSAGGTAPMHSAYEKMMDMQTADPRAFTQIGFGFRQAAADTAAWPVYFQWEEEQALCLRIIMNAGLVAPGLLHSFSAAYHEVLLQMLREVQLPVKAFCLLGPAAIEKIMEAGAGVARYPVVHTMMDMFDASVAVNATRDAVVSDDRPLTYAELMTQVNQLANYLRQTFQLQQNDRVGVLLSRSYRNVVCMLALWRCGAWYVPLDYHLPAGRLSLLMEDIAPRLVLAERRTAAVMTGAAPLAVMEDIPLHDFNGHAAQAPLSAADVAYIIYTSGSTGVPKGIMQTHGMLYNLTRWQANHSAIAHGMRYFQYASFSFDVSIQDVCFVLHTGGALYIASEEIRLDFVRMKDFILRHKIEGLYFPFSVLSNFLHVNTAEDLQGHALQHIGSGSEQVLVNGGVAAFLQSNPQVMLHNQYGPSETHVVTNYTFQPGLSPLLRRMPIGKPVANTMIYLLDDQHRLVPDGVSGEVYIAGANVAKGYWNLPDASASRFVQLEIMAGKSELLYRSGDIARRWPDGNLEYLGREDDQLKIKGYRVEPGEIQKVILQHDAVSDAAVVPVKDLSGDQHLAAYYCLKSAVTAKALQAYLGERLPDYMVPSFLVEIGALPLTPNGKLDKKQLPDPLAVKATDTCVAPETPLQAQLADLWKTVMGIGQVGIDDDFFALGGYSLKAVKLLAMIGRECKVQLELPDILRYPTIRSLAARIERPASGSMMAIPRVPEQACYTMSHGQRRMWVLDKMSNNSAAYNIAVSYQVKGPLQTALLLQALRYVTDRHESLRTVFREVNGEPFQFIQPASAAAVEVELYDGPPEMAGQHMAGNAARPFDLATGPLCRCTLASIDANEHIISLVIHHIVFDGWSMDNLVGELLEHYDALRRNPLYVPAPLPLQYKDYAAWQQSQLQSGSMERSRAYWLDRFSGELPVLDLPARPRPAIQTFRGAFFHLHCQAGMHEALRQLAAANGCSVFTVLTALVKVFLSKYSGQQDIIAGIPVSGREHPDLLPQIGFFVNTLPLRSAVIPDLSFVDFLGTVKEHFLAALEHRQYPFDMLVSDLHLQGDASRSPVFDVMISYQHLLEHTLRRIPGLEVTEVPLNTHSSKFDLTFHFTEHSDLVLTIEYNPDLFDAAQVERMSGHFENLCKVILEQPDRPLSERPIHLTEQEHDFLMQASHAAGKRSYRLIHQIVTAYAQTAAGATAIVCEGKTITYAELDRLSDEVRAYLQQMHGIGAGQRVGLLTGRNEKAVIGMLAILKAGAAYVPLLPNYPAERIRFLLQDVQAALVLTERAVAVDTDTLTVCMEDAYGFSAKAPVLPEQPATSIACVMYTSGSTGTPKGVLLTHQGIVRLVKDNNCTDITPADRLLQVSNIAFDGSLFDIYGALLNGAALYILDQDDLLSPDGFHAFTKEHRISIALITTALFNNLVNERPDIVQPFRRIYFGGEAGSLYHLAKAMPYLEGGSLLVNLYGPTEGTTVTTWHPLSAEDIRNGVIPIGQPLTNTQVYIMDEFLRLQPTGVIGEICIGGDGLAQGYLGRDDLTAALFVPHPFYAGEKLYRTGDLGYWREDGVIIFKGRKDNQVKLRGYRVECGEVEHALQKAGAQQAIVIPFDDPQDGSKFLAAYVSGTEAAAATAFKARLQALLPVYMVPSVIIHLPALPVNTNGKIDRSRLPSPFTYTAAEQSYAQPFTDHQRVIAGIWEEVLARPAIGIDDNFFEIGGNSLKAIKAIAAMNARGGSFKFTDLYKYPSIRKLTAAAGDDAPVGLRAAAMEEFDL